MRKPIVLFVVMNEISILNSSFKLAGDLEQSGKDVRYIGLPDAEEIVRLNGYSFTPVFQQQFPAGSTKKPGLEDLSQLGLHGYLRILPARVALFRSFIEYLMAGGGGEFLSLLRSIEPDIIVYCCGMPYVQWAAVMAASLRIKGVYLRATIDPCEDSGLPPDTSKIIPRGRSILEYFRIWIEWKKKRIFHKINFPGFESHTRRLAEKYGLEAYRHDPDGYRKGIGMLLPELFALHPEFDFPGTKVPGRYYIGPLVCHNRVAPDFPWQKLDRNRPLIYCSFGTVIWFRKYELLYRILLDAAALAAEWQWVITTGGAIAAGRFDAIPDNVILLECVPQADILKAASIMITHGGTSSVNECILHGVPMVVLPMGWDQYGNAARIAYHGIGIRGDINKLSVPYLMGLIRTVDSSMYIRSQTRLMRGKFLETEKARPGVGLLESLM